MADHSLSPAATATATVGRPATVQAPAAIVMYAYASCLLPPMKALSFFIVCKDGAGGPAFSRQCYTCLPPEGLCKCWCNTTGRQVHSEIVERGLVEGAVIVCKDGAGEPDFSRQCYTCLPPEGLCKFWCSTARRQLHSEILERGLLEGDIFVGTFLVYMSAKRDRVRRCTQSLCQFVQ